MTTAGTTAPERSPQRPSRRAQIGVRTLRTDRWWGYPTGTALVLLGFVVYATWAAFVNANYFYEPYISPFYSPCLATRCASEGAPHLGIFGSWWPVSPAIIILVVPLGFRLTCYYYRKAYYRSIWQSPPACAVVEPHRAYTGETRFPLILQNVHRYFFYIASILNVILTYDAVIAFRDHRGHWGHVGVGTFVLLANAALLWLYSLSCHSCRHLVGGRINTFSRHPLRYKMWTVLSRLNARHANIAWVSLIWVALTDLYIRLVAGGTFHGTWV